MIRAFRLASFAFTNISILVFGYYLLSKVAKQSLNFKATVKLKWFYGIAGGVFGLILMNFSLLIGGTIIVDLRLVPIIINSYFLGGLPAFITGMIIAIGRLAFGNHADVYIYSYLYAFIGASQLLVMPFLKQLSGIRRLGWIFLSVMIPTVYTSMFIVKHARILDIVIIVLYMMIGTFVCHYLILELQRSRESFLYFEKMSKVDFLTGLPNRYSYDKHNAILFKEIDQPVVYLFLLDINYFKQINDNYGHDVGDLALKLFATKLNMETILRERVYRLGGDEFAILLTDYSPLEIVEIAGILRKKIAEIEIPLPEGEKINLSASLGISNSQMASSAAELYKIADVQLYKDKKRSHNHVEEASTFN